MWVLLEGDPSPIEIEVDQSRFASRSLSLDRLKKDFLKKEFDKLEYVGRNKIECFLGGTLLRSGTILTEDTTTDENPLVIRYPFSESHIVVTYKSGNSSEEYEMPHSSGSWSLLRQDVIENFRRLPKFEEVEAHELCFEYFINGKNKQIKDEFQFNSLATRTEVKNGIRALPDLKVQIKDKKCFSNWDIREAFIKVLDKEFASLSDYQTFNLEELPSDHNPISEIELKSFVEEIEKTLRVFKKNVNINEMTVREYVSVFMKTAVDHIQKTNDTAELLVEYKLNGSKAYGPVDYLVKINELAVLINEAKMQDILKGVAQMIMQLHSASEKLLGKRKLDETGFESPTSLFGIVTTGSSWVFIRWTGSSEKPNVEFSRQYMCNFGGDLQSEKEVVSHIVRILKTSDSKLKNNSKRVCINMQG